MIVAILCVRDDADVLVHTLPHVLETADLVLATDHGSTDGTSEVFSAYGDRVHVTREDHPSFDRQVEWMNRMVWQARTRLDAKWVIPFDADEFFVPGGRAPAKSFEACPTYPHPPPPRPPLRQTLLSYVAAGPMVLTCRVFEHSCPKLRALAPEPLPKVIFTPHDRARLTKGSHALEGHPGPLVPHVAEVRRWAYRSREQFVRKTRKHLATQPYLLSPAGPHNDHYRDRFGKSDSELCAMYERWAERSSQVRDPIPGVTT